MDTKIMYLLGFLKKEKRVKSKKYKNSEGKDNKNKR